LDQSALKTLPRLGKTAKSDFEMLGFEGKLHFNNENMNLQNITESESDEHRVGSCLKL